MSDLMQDCEQIQGGWSHDPFRVLGRHAMGSGEVIRAFLPTAMEVELVGVGPMQRVGGYDVYEVALDFRRTATGPLHYSIRWREADDRWHEVVSPYGFAPCLYDDDLYLFGQGRHHHAYRFLGAHLKRIDDIDGCLFSVWAPGVTRVSVVGTFNAWNGLRHPMRCRGDSGVWELFVPGVTGSDLYKFEIRDRHGHVFLKADPYARAMTLRPDTACRVPVETIYRWQDARWMRGRSDSGWLTGPLSIYEVHLGSWRRNDAQGFLDFAQIADELIPYVVDLGFTHIELLPVMEHPLDESWGYQVSGFFAPSARFGEADQFRYLVDACHRVGIGVILDWVPGHFPKDDFALARFTGEPLYEHPDPRRGEHRDWGTLIFDYGRCEVRNFLLANAVYWCEEFHIDGLRVDAVASMLYLDYSRPDGEWLPNILGGRENLEAIEFLRELNRILHGRFPGVLTIAEESTAWPMVSRPVDVGGLGFSMKWNMGWMNDTLYYFERDPVYRRYHHDRLTFGQMYAYSENFVLPLSHDEVVHMKGSLIGKMPGDRWQQFAGVRLLLAWQYATPGKKLLFMGNELAQWSEWRVGAALDWFLARDADHLGVQSLVRELNTLYRAVPSLHRHDFDACGFQWLDCDDARQSAISFMRRDDASQTICIFNMTPVVRHGYRLGVPHPGGYRELLNTDSRQYGGSNLGNLGHVQAEGIPSMGQPFSVSLVLPPLAAIFLGSDGPYPEP